MAVLRNFRLDCRWLEPG